LGEDKRFWSSTEVLLEVELRELFGSNFLSQSSVGGKILGINKSITEDSFAFVYPKSDKVIWLFDSILFGLKETLEHIGQVTYVELIMEVLGSLSELKLDISE